MSSDKPAIWMVTSTSDGGLLQPHARTCRMTDPVVGRLRSMGLCEPVPLSALSGKWWSILVDMAAIEYDREPGCAMRQLDASTEQIINHFASYYCEVVAGPVDRQEALHQAYLSGEGVDHRWLGNQVQVLKAPAPAFARLAAMGLHLPVPLPSLAGMFWVCGRSGGVQSTEQLMSLVRPADAWLPATDGPFQHEDDAQYALDLLWEAPE